MRKWLILILVVIAALAALAVWLAGKAEDGKPEAEEVRIEVEDVF